MVLLKLELCRRAQMRAAIVLCLVLLQMYGSRAEAQQYLCPVVLLDGLNSKTAKVGTTIEAALKQSLRISDTYTAPPGSIVSGRVTDVVPQRTQVKSIFTTDRWLNTDACLTIIFDEVVCPDRSRFRIDGQLARQQSKVSLATGHLRVCSVGKNGKIVNGKKSLRTPAKVANIVGQNVLSNAAIVMGPVPAMAGAPALMATAGAVSPEFILNKPVGAEEGHPRLKAMATGAFSALPGSSIVSAFIFKGDNIDIPAGEELLLSCRPFTVNAAPVLSVAARLYGFPVQSNPSESSRVNSTVYSDLPKVQEPGPRCKTGEDEAETSTDLKPARPPFNQGPGVEGPSVAPSLRAPLPEIHAAE